MTIKDDTATCDDCGLHAPITEQKGWAQLHVKPKGIPVTLDLCDSCNKARIPKQKVIPTPELSDCLSAYQVTGYLLWCSGHLIDIHLPTKRSAIVTVKECDEWHVMDTYEDTDTGKAQLLSVVDYLSNIYADLWDESNDHGLNYIERTKWCSQKIFDI